MSDADRSAQQGEVPAPAAQRRRVRRDILGAPIDVITWREALDLIAAWAAHRESRVVCICNVHSVDSATRDPSFRRLLENADLATPDGMPVAWMLRRLGFRSQPRIDGPGLMWRICAESQLRGVRIFLYGGSERTLAHLRKRLISAFPGLTIVGSHSPPFRPLDAREDDEEIQIIESSGAQVVFVSLGCPKQEHWMNAHHGRISAVMVGVGAAFNFHAGLVPRAPRWMQSSGLEWMHRLVSEPRRLWRRYLPSNTRYLVGAVRQLLTARKGQRDPDSRHTPRDL